MNEESFNEALAAVIALNLMDMDNLVLAAANNALTQWRTINPEVIAYKPFLHMGIIKEGGSPHALEETLAALDLVIQNRLRAGTWT